MDLRLPIGLLFVLLGVLISAYGVLSDQGIYAVSLGVNVNLGWGLVMLAFGIVMLALAWRGRRLSAR